MRIITGLILLLILSSVFGLIVVKEGYGATQPGVFVQLASTHVPTAEDNFNAVKMPSRQWPFGPGEDEEAARRYPYQVNREIANMTGSPLF
jgi:hypothetical protein